LGGTLSLSGQTWAILTSFLFAPSTDRDDAHGT
jgi:hypothetical protein